MKRATTLIGVLGTVALVAGACGGTSATTAPTAPPATAAPTAAALTTVSLQLQWAPQAQFAGYFAADREGYFAAQGLKVNLVPGGPTVDNQTVGSDPNGPEFTVAWVPKVLVLRDKGQSDLVDIAQVFQRSGTREVSWKTTGISSPADWKGNKVGVWDFGNDYEVIAAARKQTPPLENPADYTRVIQPFDMSLLLQKQIDTAEGMIYNEYAQVLEATNPDTGKLYQPEDLNLINFNDVGTAMLQDAIWARSAWLAKPGNEDVAVRFLTAAFQGWAFCRDYPAKCVQYTTDAGSTLGAGHQAWMMNEINPLIWPSPNGIGDMPKATWDQTVQISLDAKLLTKAPDSTAYRTDLATKARAKIPAGADLNGNNFTKGTVTVTPKGE